MAISSLARHIVFPPHPETEFRPLHPADIPALVELINEAYQYQDAYKG